jgi:hypothetical protein
VGFLYILQQQVNLSEAKRRTVGVQALTNGHLTDFLVAAFAFVEGGSKD